MNEFRGLLAWIVEVLFTKVFFGTALSLSASKVM